jgi:undecaprenyl pyrophosphate phosphatase UppP
VPVDSLSILESSAVTEFRLSVVGALDTAPRADFDAVDGLTFDVALHIGTLLAVVVYFWGDLRWLARGFLGSIARTNGPADPAGRLAWYVVAACVPAGLIGALFEADIEAYFRHPSVIVVTLLLGAFLFLWVERRFRSEVRCRGCRRIKRLRSVRRSRWR